MCECVLSILCFGLPFLELFIWNDLFKLLQGYHSNILDPKNSQTRNGFTWSNSMDMYCNSDNKSQCYIEIFKMKNIWKCKNIISLFVKLCHCCEELHQATLIIKHKFIHAYVPICIKWMHFFYRREPRLKFVVFVPFLQPRWC